MRMPHPSVIFSNHSGRFSNFLTPNLLAMEQLACRGRCRHGGMHRRCSARAGCAAAYTAAGLPTQQRGRAQNASRRPAGACATKILECTSASRGHGQLPRDHLPVTACSSAAPCGYHPTLPRPTAAAAPRLLASLCGLSALAAHPLVLGRSPQTTRSRRRSQCRLPRRSSPPKPPAAAPSKAAPCAPGAVCHAAAPRAGSRRHSFLCGRRAAAPNGPARCRSGEASHSPLAARARER